jgi:hypothetical protein
MANKRGGGAEPEQAKERSSNDDQTLYTCPELLN